MVYHSNFISDDGGLLWESIGGDTATFTPVGGGILSDGTIILCSAMNVYSSVDGVDWSTTSVDYNIKVCAVQGDEVILGGDFGVFTGPADGPFDLVLEEPTTFLKANNGSIAGITNDNAVIVRTEDGAWLTLPIPDETLSSVVANPIGKELTVYAGLESGGILYWDDTDEWIQCGKLPDMERPNIVQLDATSSLIVAGAAQKGPFVSEDDCTTWDTDRTTGLDNQFTPISGGANSDEEAVTVLEVFGDRIVTAGWQGFYQSDDAGVTWREIPLGAGDRCLNISFAPNFSTSGRLYVATLSGGLLVTTDGGATATSPMLGVQGSYISNVSTPPVFEGSSPRHVWAIISGLVWFSGDNGTHWERVNTPYDTQFSVTAIHALDKESIWISSTAFSDLTIWQGVNVLSEDAGETWQDLTVLEQVLPRAGFVIRINRAEGHRYLAGASTGLAYSDDPLNSWTKIKDIESNAQRWFFAHYPETDPTHIVTANNTGQIFLSTDQAETFTETFVLNGDSWVDIAFTETGELFGTTDKGYIYKNVDYNNWTEVAQVPSWPTALAAHPNFGETPELIVATYTGPYMVDFSSESPEVARLGGIERILSGSGFIDCPSCDPMDNMSSNEATLGVAFRLVEGVSFHLPVRGHTISIVGKINEKGDALITIDDTEYHINGDATEGFEEIFVVSGLSDNYHYVTIEGTVDGDIIFDYIDGISEANFLSVPPRVEDTGTGVDDTECGCASNQGNSLSWLWLSPVLAFISRRRLTA
jgi:photosystem II stability/assembly factor-like uncharacterized protein